jgi:hypothetical protein
MRTVSLAERAEFYNLEFPDRPPLVAGNGWLTGTWCIGAAYKNPNPLYGAYPRGYLERVHCLFPEATSVLHAFSGGLTKEAALAVAGPGVTDVELVDLVEGRGRHPTWQGDVTELPVSWRSRFDLILCDPPYGKDDAERYGTPMPSASSVMASLWGVAREGANLVWLDQKWPMHQKRDWQCWGHVGLVRSTNHRVRLVSMFRRQG